VAALLIAGETYIANLNADTQIVIAGTDEAMARVAQKALAIGATKAQRLAVSVPSHCALLDTGGGAGAGVHPGLVAAPALRLPERLHRAGTVGSAADRRRSGDEYGADGALAGYRRRRPGARRPAGDRDAARRRADLPHPPGGLAGESLALESSGVAVARHLARRLNG
jgi:malonate decarboxylase epsilon subunit